MAYIYVPLAGKAAVELYYSDPSTPGCVRDIQNAYDIIRDRISNEATHGFGMVDVATHQFSDTSESLNSRNEAVTQAELERCMVITRDILLKNRAFLEKVTDALVKKETLLYSDIEKIRKSVKITKVAA
jgi:cell division protease FtsH